MATTALIFDLTNQQFIQSLTQPTIVNTLAWFYGDVKQLSIRFVKRTSANAVEVMSGTGVTMQMAIGAPAVSPTVDTSATAAAADGNDAFAVTLYLNVAGVATAIGANSQVARTLEFSLTTSAGPERYQVIIYIKQRLITGTLTDTPAPDVALGSNQALSIFVPRDGSQTGYENSGFVMVDEEDTTKRYFLSIRAGQLHVEALT